MKPNLQRMLQLIDEVFATRSDPDQLQVTPQQQKKLQAIHPATLTERADKDGPYIWVLMIPTSSRVMNDFISGKISESRLLQNTSAGEEYDTIYLCSVTTLPEYRGRGETKQACLEAIRKISADHPVHTLFVWPFTGPGDGLAHALAKETGLRLLKREA